MLVDKAELHASFLVNSMKCMPAVQGRKADVSILLYYSYSCSYTFKFCSINSIMTLV